ncbi:ATP-binding cassette domain-containing protein [Pseudomonadota bacterium]
MLSVRNLKRLGIGPLDLDVAPGERLALSGPSGAGKSLLLRAIADLDPNEGVFSLGDVNRAAMTAPEWRKQVMYVPAHAGWWADRVEPHFAGAARDTVKGLLHSLDLETTCLGWEVPHLSTGERQRIALARALALGPKMVLLDEPTSGLDADNVARAEALITKTSDDGAGVIFITHDEAQAKRLGTRRVKLEMGQLTEVAL